MDHTSLVLLFIGLLALVALSAFFSSSETGMMSLNRYRLRHLAREGNRTAQRVQSLLERPDRLLGVILIGNTFANILASSLATLIAVHLFGDIGILYATIILTLIILIFAEMAPKTLAALYPQQLAFVVSLPLSLLLKLLYPIVWFANSIANGALALLSVRVKKRKVTEHLSAEELKTVVHESVKPEASDKASGEHKDMLLSVLDLRHVTVDDAMLPRNEIVGIDLNQSWEKILKLLITTEYSRLPVYYNSIDKVIGILKINDAFKLLSKNRLSKQSIIKSVIEPYFIPEGTPLNVQLHKFRNNKRRSALIVDEYGEIIGAIRLEDILEEIVGELDTNISSVKRYVSLQKDGSYLVNAAVLVRELNKYMGWDLPVDGPKTLSGLIVERLETIPDASVGLEVSGYPIEVISMKGNRVMKVKIYKRRISD